MGAEAAGPFAAALARAVVAIVAIVAAGRGLGALCRKSGQPPVIGEMLAGLMLGPSLLGALAPRVMGALFPPSVMPLLDLAAQAGVVLYMFLIGVELNTDMVVHRVRAAVLTASASILIPLGLGVVLALVAHQTLADSHVPRAHFAAFLGVAMSITAFPVLARILLTLGMTRTPLGALALACAALNDVAAWILLAFVAGLARARTGGTASVALLTATFVLVLFVIVRPVFARLVRAWHPWPLALLVVTTLGLLGLSAWTTASIGIHAVFGAFLFGSVISHDGRLAQALERILARPVSLLLPAFFALTGLRVQVSLLSTSRAWVWCLLLVLVASVGKVGGTALGARLSGLTWRHSIVLGTLMNTRGLMELIVLTVGLDLGVINGTAFTMLAIMAVATTMMTAPAVRWLRSCDRAWEG